MIGSGEARIAAVRKATAHAVIRALSSTPPTEETNESANTGLIVSPVDPTVTPPTEAKDGDIVIVQGA